MMSLSEVVRAAHLAGAGKTCAEVTKLMEIRDHSAIRQALAMHGVHFRPQPFGMRTVSITLTRAEVATLTRAAKARELPAVDALQAMTQTVCRAAASNETMLDAIVDDGTKTPPAR
jgi:hypothetical protein